MDEMHVMVSGRVQGVGFRDATQRRAHALCLSGWVRNRTNGAVEVYANGDAAALTAFAQWLRQGPPLARVDRVETLPVDDAIGALAVVDQFFVLPTTS
jgi:acylphosphatase